MNEKVIYDALECILKCLHYIIISQTSDKELKEVISRYIESTVKKNKWGAKWLIDLSLELGIEKENCLFILGANQQQNKGKYMRMFMAKMKHIIVGSVAS